MVGAKEILKALESLEDKGKVQIYLRFFKTGKGEYGEGDKFLGISVPAQRLIARKFVSASLDAIEELLGNSFHECRLTALLILVEKYRQADTTEKNKIYKLYLKNFKNINNWDLVDLSAPKITGEYLVANKGERKILYTWIKSNNLWERRIAILSTFAFIRENDFTDLIKIANLLLSDSHDLIHKALGWMLREAGKRDLKILKEFLDKNKEKMPRTMLRYAIEKLPEAERRKYLNKKIIK